MSTSDISGNESSDGSGSFLRRVIHPKHSFLLADSPTHMGDEQSSDAPFMLRSAEGKVAPLLEGHSLLSLSLVASARRELYSMGLIDILTYYGMKKKSAHVAKTKLSGSDADGISTVRPEIYARRFLDFVDRHFT